jgi:hypothetical protein
MRRLFVPACGIGLAMAMCGLPPASAQPGPAADPAAIALPDLNFTPTPQIAENYDKYFFFHRPDTDFASAYSDLQECDGYARGLSYRAGGGPVPYPYAGTLAGALGGAIGNAVADAVWGSAERRRLRRVNMRTCMGFKGYRIYGLPKSIWEQFNFEEGNARIEEDRRQQLLRLQARAASGPTPQVGEITQ